MSPFAQIIRNGAEEQIESAWQNILTSTDPVRSIREKFGEISVGQNGLLYSEVLNSGRPEDEFALLRALSIMVSKGALPPIKRLTIQLSADSPFPYFIMGLIENPSFATLYLNRFRGEIPRDFWTLCTNFVVKAGQPSWHYQIVAPPNIMRECNYHRLKALCEAARKKEKAARSIKTLYLWNQNLNRLPNHFGRLESLERLELWGNPIERAPQSTVMLFNLKTIVFSKKQKKLSEDFTRILPHVTIGWT
jgi:hypothetical protein